MPALPQPIMAPTTTNFRQVAEAEVPRVLAGTIMFLPPKDKPPKSAWTDPELLDGAFNHPVAIVSCPQPKEIQHSSHVEIAIMTSFHGLTVKAHLAAKGIHTASGTLAAERSGHLRVVTASKPHAKDVLKLRDGKGMKRDSCYVGIRHTYAVELRVLALYGFGREEVDAYRLTAHATKKLVESVRVRAKEKERAKEKAKMVKQEGEEKDSMKKMRVESVRVRGKIVQRRGEKKGAAKKKLARQSSDVEMTDV